MNVCIKTPEFRNQADGVSPGDKSGEPQPETTDGPAPPDDASGPPDAPDASDRTETPTPNDTTDATDGEPAPEPQADEPAPEPPLPDNNTLPDTIDECNTTAECQAKYGPSATDCVNSRSDQSYCQCGASRCRQQPTPPDQPPADVTSDMPADSGPEEPNTEPSTPLRVSTDLIALYRFDKGSGTKVFDVSGFGSKLDLTISGKSNRYKWLNNGGLEITNEIRISHNTPTKLYTEIKKTKAFTIEIWCKPANLSQDGPARMVSLSKDHDHRNFTMGQDKKDMVLRLRVSDTSSTKNGEPYATETDAITATRSHFVATYDGTDLSLYKDGKFLDSFARNVNFGDWDTGYPFIIANEIKDNRKWYGEIYLVAVYRRGLTPTEVLQNFQAGHR